MQGLMMHSGGRVVSFEELANLPAPESKGRFHRPIPHAEFIGAVRNGLADLGYKSIAPGEESYGLSSDGGKIFGVIKLGESLSPGSAVTLGVRGSTDESIAMQGIAGVSVFVCDNMAFSGSEFLFSRKYTLHARLDFVVRRGLERFVTEKEALADTIGKMARVSLGEKDAESVFARMIKANVLPDRYLTSALRLYFDHPADFTDIDSSLWGIHNAGTRALRDASIPAKMEHSQSLTRFLSAAA